MTQSEYLISIRSDFGRAAAALNHRANGVKCRLQAVDKLLALSLILVRGHNGASHVILNGVSLIERGIEIIIVAA